MTALHCLSVLHLNMDLVNIRMRDVKIDRVYLLPATMGIDAAIAVFVAAVKMDFERYAAELDLVVESEPIRFVANIWKMQNQKLNHNRNK